MSAALRRARICQSSTSAVACSVDEFRGARAGLMGPVIRMSDDRR